MLTSSSLSSEILMGFALGRRPIWEYDFFMRGEGPGMSNAFEGSPWDAEKSREGVHGMARTEHGSRISERNDFCGLCKGEKYF